jgi:signal transduction histidine kinase
VQEITEKKRAEAEIRALLAELEQRVRELTALYEAARVLQDDHCATVEWLHAFPTLLPGAVRFPAAARVRWGDQEGATPFFPCQTPWILRADFATADGTAGSIEVAYREERPPADEGPFLTGERRLLDVLAEMLRMALDRRQAEEALRRSYGRIQELTSRVTDAGEAERAHLARELHDEIGQSLTGLKMMLAATHDMPAAAPTADGAVLRHATETVDDLIRRVREISITLRPPHIDLLGLLPTLQWHVQRYTEQTGIHVALRHRDVSRRFTPRVELAAYRIVQEALTNIAHHAGVLEAVVQVWANDAALFLQIEDAGCGFEPDGAARQRQGVGLLGMEERARLLGGACSVESSPGSGTIVRAELSLEEETDTTKGSP